MASRGILNRCLTLKNQMKMLTNCGNNYLESYYFKQNSFLVTIINTRLFSSSPTDGRQQFNFLPGEKLPLEGAAEEEAENVERWELLQKVKGLDNPFEMNTLTVPAGTQAKPTLVPTIYKERTMGCICKPDSLVIKWMRLELGETQQCDCGHWFKLVPLEE
ncbi:COX5B [Bugula neritina]|uniref:COX5B n=1 Tax=Bugula neritina TaxID=10212 RepID=A0A7J7KD96_BUGNE|nr:COX5B [Bugula neritina]